MYSYAYIYMHSNTYIFFPIIRVVRKKTRKFRKKNQNQVIGDLTVTEDEDCLDVDTSSYVKNVVKALELGDGQVLLAVAWVTKKARIYHLT